MLWYERKEVIAEDVRDGMIHVEPPEVVAKARVIEIMGNVKLRLRQRGIYMGVGKEEGEAKGETLIDRIRRYNPQVDLSGGRFSDIFLSRPTRLVNAKVIELTATFECIVSIDTQVLPADELIELCNLMRVPINELSRFASLYTADAWRDALRPYNLAQQYMADQSVLVGRNAIIEDTMPLLNVLYQRDPHQHVRHLILSGPSGIGKSALVLGMLQRLDPVLRERTYTVYLHDQITTIEDVYRSIGQAAKLPPYGSETWQQRLTQSNHLNYVVVILDNLQDYQHISAEHVLSHVMRTLPYTRFVVTTQVVALAEQLPFIHEITVPALSDGATRELFWMVYDEVERVPLGSEEVDGLLQATHNSPMQVIMVANGGMDARKSSSTQESFLQYLSPSATRILYVLTLLNTPIRIDVLAFLLGIDESIGRIGLRSDVWALRRRQLIQQQRHDGLMTHDAIRLLVRSSLDDTQYQQLLVDIGETIAQFSHEFLIEDDPLVQRIQDYEVMALHELLLRLRDAGEFTILAQAVVRWRMIWIRFGLSAELCALATDCISYISETNPLYADVLFAIGSFYGHRGLVDQAFRYLTRSMEIADRMEQIQIWAKSALECGLHALPQIGWHESERLLLRAMAAFESIGEMGLMARCQDTLAYVYFVAGEVRQAMRMNDMAIQTYTKVPQSYGIADAYSNRGLIYMAMGDYELARHEVMKAEQLLIKLNSPANMAAVQLRLAAIHVFAHQAEEARYYLNKAFSTLERTGGINDVMYLIDIYAGVALTEGNGRLAYQLSEACTHVRQLHNLPRGTALDQMVKRQLEYAELISNDSKGHPNVNVPMSAHVRDLIAFVRSQLLPIQHP